MSTYTRFCRGLAAFSVAILPAFAMAQSDSDDEGGVIEEIVVTAQKRGCFGCGPPALPVHSKHEQPHVGGRAFRLGSQ